MDDYRSQLNKKLSVLNESLEALFEHVEFTETKIFDKTDYYVFSVKDLKLDENINTSEYKFVPQMDVCILKNSINKDIVQWMYNTGEHDFPLQERYSENKNLVSDIKDVVENRRFGKDFLRKYNETMISMVVESVDSSNIVEPETINFEYEVTEQVSFIAYDNHTKNGTIVKREINKLSNEPIYVIVCESEDDKEYTVAEYDVYKYKVMQ